MDSNEEKAVTTPAGPDVVECKDGVCLSYFIFNLKISIDSSFVV